MVDKSMVCDKTQGDFLSGAIVTIFFQKKKKTKTRELWNASWDICGKISDEFIDLKWKKKWYC